MVETITFVGACKGIESGFLFRRWCRISSIDYYTLGADALWESSGRLTVAAPQTLFEDLSKGGEKKTAPLKTSSRLDVGCNERPSAKSWKECLCAQ